MQRVQKATARTSSCPHGSRTTLKGKLRPEAAVSTALMSATLWLLLLSSVLASGEAHVVANGVARRARTRWKKGVPAMKNAPPIRRGAEKAELAAAMAAAATSRTGTHAAMVAIVKSLFRVEEPAEEPATAPGGDDGIRVVAEATEGSSSSEVVLPPE